MKKNAVSGFFSVVGVACLLGTAVPPAHAQLSPQLEKLKEQIEKRNQLEAELKQHKASKQTAKPIERARDAASAEKWDEALKQLDIARAAEGRTPTDDYLIDEVQGFVLHRKGDVAGAAAAYDRALASGLVPADKQLVKGKNVIQMYFEVKDYAKAAESGQRMLGAIAQPDTEFRMMVARAQYLGGKHRESIQTVDGAIEATRAAGGTPEEMWYQMRMSSYTELKDSAGSVTALQDLALQFPKKQYWAESFRLFKNQSGLDTRARHNLYRLMYDTGTISNGMDVVNFYQESMRTGLPAEAVSMLQRGKELNMFTGENNLRVEQEYNAEAQKAMAADKKALGELEAAAKASKSGDVDVQQGVSFMSYGQYDKAVEAIERGQKKGGVKNAAEADLMLGRSYFKLGRKAEAEAAFGRVAANATSSDKVQAQYGTLAKFWLVYARDPAVLTAEAAPAAK